MVWAAAGCGAVRASERARVLVMSATEYWGVAGPITSLSHLERNLLGSSRITVMPLESRAAIHKMRGRFKMGRCDWDEIFFDDFHGAFNGVGELPGRSFHGLAGMATTRRCMAGSPGAHCVGLRAVLGLTSCGGGAARAQSRAYWFSTSHSECDCGSLFDVVRSIRAIEGCCCGLLLE